MYTRGEFTTNNVKYDVTMNYDKLSQEIILVTSNTVVSAYKEDQTGKYSYNNTRAKEFMKFIKDGVKSCNSKNSVPMPFELGAMTQHEFTKSKVGYIMQMYKGMVCGAYIQSESVSIEINYVKDAVIPPNIPYVKLLDVKKQDFEVSEDELNNVPVRSVQEIALEKEDLTWLQNKKYYIVNDDETAEKLFSFFDQYNGVIAYDTETTGLKINCFSKINSSYSKTLEKYNNEHPDDQIRADRLVGIIFCVEKDVSYYFPCFNRKFKNLYEDVNSPFRNNIISNAKARYTVGDLRDYDGDMREYIVNTKPEDFRLDVILMERVRNILTKKHLVAHNGSFEWKVGWCFEIDTNICDDTMIMHQLMYKFRSTTSNRGEPSNLKYLAKHELGVDQWELNDFFPELKEDKTGTVRKQAGEKSKSAGSRIDFSYMDYEGTKVYAPTDGDVTFALFELYKKDLIENHKEMEYIYSVEIIVSCAVAYMEFYGHRIDEAKILGARDQTKANIALIISQMRQMINYSSQSELEAYNELKTLNDSIDAEHDEEAKQALLEQLPSLTDKLNAVIDSNNEHVINFASPAQVADLFYNKLGMPVKGDKPSVAKKEIKQLMKEKKEDGSPAYPIVALYSKYKNEDTLLTKFFGNLPYFMYPGGFIFSSYGQISTATGRMSCSRPNAQQYPKIIAKIVIPRDGYVMLDADYSQIEYRVLTALAKNEELAKLFSDPDSDYHTLMASLMNGVEYSAVTPQMRSAAKSFNFGIPYGMGIASLSILLYGNRSAQAIEDTKEKYELYFKNQPRTRRFFDDIKEMAQVNKYTRTLFNRYRYYSFTDKDGNVNNAKKAASLRQAGNAVIQGCVHGDTLIETQQLGIHKIKDLVNTHLKVFDGRGWSNADILYSGKKRKCIITFNNEQQFICSPTHKFLPSLDGILDDESTYVECKDLKVGDAVRINNKSKLKPKYFDDYNKSVEELYVQSVEITDEYIDMYDVCNTDGGHYVADGIITHNTAADIFKIGVARNFNFIRRNKLYGKLLIVNMIHDEQLIEVDVQHLNLQRVVTEVGKNMQFSIEGFPPLYIGAGVGKAWGYAKGKMAEIHPLLLEQMTSESENIPLFREDTSYIKPSDAVDSIESRVYEFRKRKVAEYLSNPDNWYKDIHPAIGSLINLQFNYGRGDDAKAYVGPNGETYSDSEFLELNIADFLKENNINAEASWFKANATMSQQKEEDKEKEDSEYDDEENEDGVDPTEDMEEDGRVFSKIDESDVLYGSSLQDLIGIFGVCMIEAKHICGIDMRNVYYKNKDAIIDFIIPYVCDPEDPDGLEIVFLVENNILNRTGQFIKGLDAPILEKKYKSIVRNTTGGQSSSLDYKDGDIDNRSQAK